MAENFPVNIRWICISLKKNCNFRMTFTWTENVEMSSYHNQEISGYRQKSLKITCKTGPRTGGFELQGPVSWRLMTVKWWQVSQSNCHSTISTRQTKYHEALPSSANYEVRCDCTFADDGKASWYSVCWVPMVEWRLEDALPQGLLGGFGW